MFWNRKKKEQEIKRLKLALNWCTNIDFWIALYQAEVECGRKKFKGPLELALQERDRREADPVKRDERSGHNLALLSLWSSL